MSSLELRPAVRLLAHWGPTRPGTGAPAFVTSTVDGTLPDPAEWPWAVPPEPERFDLGSGGRPSAVEVLNHAVREPNGWTSARDPEDVAENVRALLGRALGPGLDEGANELIAAIAVELAGFPDLVRLTVEGGGLRLLGRDPFGVTITISIRPSTVEHADHVERARLAAEVLGEYVWITNNDRMRVEVTIEPHRVDLANGAVDASFRSWWATSATAAKLGEDYWDDEPAMGLLDADALAAVRAGFLTHNLDNARSGAWAMELIGYYDIDDDPQPGFPGDRLVELLTAGVFDGLVDALDGPELVYGIGFPVDGKDEDGLLGALLFVGSERVGVVAISAVA